MNRPAALAAIYEVAQGGETALATAKIANLDADTRLKELREARERGDLIPAWVVEQVWAAYDRHGIDRLRLVVAVAIWRNQQRRP